MKIENVRIYWPQANIENFSFFFFTSLPTIFGGWVFQIYCQDKAIIVKNGFLKIFVYEKRPQESYNESMDKHIF